MVARQGRDGSIDGAETAELHRDLLAVFIHELGGVASALQLRVSALSSLSDADQHALLAAVEQVREITRSMRIARGVPASDVLSPTRFVDVEAWWRFASRAAAAALPRGVRLDVQLRPGQLSFPHAWTLTQLWLASCKALADSGTSAPTTIAVEAGSRAAGLNGVLVVARVPGGERLAHATGVVPVRWERFASRLASAHGADLSWWTVAADGAREWRCVVGADGSS